MKKAILGLIMMVSVGVANAASSMSLPTIPPAGILMSMGFLIAHADKNQSPDLFKSVTVNCGGGYNSDVTLYDFKNNSDNKGCTLVK